MSRPNGTLPPIPTEKVEYDNSSFANHGYTNTLQASVPQEYETPFSLNKDVITVNRDLNNVNTSSQIGNNGNVSVIHVAMDLNGNRDKLTNGIK